MCYVYVLRSISYPKQIYTGFTHDLRHHMNQHNCGHSAHTRKYLTSGSLLCSPGRGTQVAVHARADVSTSPAAERPELL